MDKHELASRIKLWIEQNILNNGQVTPDRINPVKFMHRDGCGSNFVAFVALGNYVFVRMIPDAIAKGERAGREIVWRELITGQIDKVPIGDVDGVVTLICCVLPLNQDETAMDLVVINSTHADVVAFTTDAQHWSRLRMTEFNDLSPVTA